MSGYQNYNVDEISDEKSPLVVGFVSQAVSADRSDYQSLGDSGLKLTEVKDVEAQQENGNGGSHCHKADQSSNNNTRARQKLIIASVLCLVFMIGEAVGGILARSLAIATDAAHLLTDFASFMISLFSLYMASRPATKQMSFGWHRAEVMGALVSVLLIWVVTGVLVYIAIVRVMHMDFTINSTIMLITSGVGVSFNLLMGLTLHQSIPHLHGHSHASKNTVSDQENNIPQPKDATPPKENINVKAAFIHVLGDIIQSFGVFIAALIIFFKPEWKIVDPVCTFLFSLLVIATTISILRDTLVVLMEGVPKNLTFNDVKVCICEIPGVKEVHNLRLWSLTVNRVAVSAHIAIDADANPQTVLNAATTEIQNRFDITECTLQVEQYEETMADCTQCQDPKD